MGRETHEMARSPRNAKGARFAFAAFGCFASFVIQRFSARVVQQLERLRAQHREAERQAEHFFQTLLHGAFA